MCLSCTLEELLGTEHYDGLWSAIPWPEVTQEMKTLARLRWVLYECTSAVTGGPMHIFTDDYNVGDDHLDSCEKATQGDHWSDDERPDWDLVRAISSRMIELARPMTNVQRATSLSLSWGEIHVDFDGNVLPGRYMVGERKDSPDGRSFRWEGRFIGQMPYLPP